MKGIIISIIIVVALIGGAILLSPQNSVAPNTVISDDTKNNVTIENGQQVINISAKGGYFPRQSVAKAGIPTILRFNTSGTFDCSASVRIPSLKIGKFLPQNGSTDIAIGSPLAGIFYGSCGMGMYPFEVDFVLQ